MSSHFDRDLENQEHHVEVDPSTPDRRPRKKPLLCKLSQPLMFTNRLGSNVTEDNTWLRSFEPKMGSSNPPFSRKSRNRSSPCYRMNRIMQTVYFDYN